MAMQIAAMTGQWIDPRMIIPGQVDPEKLRQAREKAAERAMDKSAKG